MGDETSYWEWRDALLKHPDGRALGGEPCIRCGEPVPPNAHWKQRDRHVCSERCNRNLSRHFNRHLRSADETPIPRPTPLPDPRVSPSGQWFGTLEGTGAGESVYEYEGFRPLPGDVVERHGVLTRYEWHPPGPVTDRGLYVAWHESGHAFALATDPEDWSRCFIFGDLAPDGSRRDTYTPFTVAEQTLVWRQETIRDVTPEGREWSWRAQVCIPASAPHPGLMWSSAYDERSRRLKRTSASTGRHARRVRLEQATVERFDPREVFERDGWVCQICDRPVSPSLRWPDPMSASLDHVIPLAALGEHSRGNTQLAHWICNVRKGARTHGAVRAP